MVAFLLFSSNFSLCGSVVACMVWGSGKSWSDLDSERSGAAAGGKGVRLSLLSETNPTGIDWKRGRAGAEKRTFWHQWLDTGGAGDSKKLSIQTPKPSKLLLF